MNESYENDLGIIVASDASQEHLIPYFYVNLRLHSDLPITFFDLGMSVLGRQFCEKRGNVISIAEPLFYTDDESPEGMRKFAWFKKPLVIKKAPYQKNLWLDLDCKVVKPIDHIFDFLKDDVVIAIYEEPLCQPKISYNSGVFAFIKDSPFIDLWIETSRLKATDLRGDQDALTLVLKQNLSQVQHLSCTWNHLRQDVDPSYPQDTLIIHYVGIFKKFLYFESVILEKLCNPKSVNFIPEEDFDLLGISS